VHGIGESRPPVLIELPGNLSDQVAAALREDIGAGDVTARLVPDGERVSGTILSRESAVLCGAPWVDEVFRQLDPQVRLDWAAHDGERVSPDQVLCRLEGPARPILTGERTALNFLQTLSGTASATRRYVDAVAGTGCTILDTRKTLPGLRLAQKYAVRCGGGRNHRLGLYDMVLIKENHIAAAGGVGAAIANARREAPGIEVEVEVESLAELDEALLARPDIVMLDELSLEDMREAVRRTRERAAGIRLEASGGVDLASLRTVAETGVDYISVGSLTKHVHALDLSMRLTAPRRPPRRPPLSQRP
jgi:nicotinate-nucleotide pyrophosphorylase (carboxylating)